MSAGERRAYNAAHARRMAPLRATRARFWNLVKSHGYHGDGDENVTDTEPCATES